MFTLGVTRLRMAVLTALVAISGSGVRFFDAQVWTLAPGASPQTIDANSLMASLPSGLTPPAAPGLRVVAMVASDIDADGDLDLVANDGSLDLIVWINDGTGHLTRQAGHQRSGWIADFATATSDKGQALACGLVAASPSIDRTRSLLHCAIDSGRATTPDQPALDSRLSLSTSPRAPPPPLFTL
jgi:hypothetical protein